MELTQTHLLPVPLQTAWDALNDPAVLQRCIPGCESITAAGDNAYDVAMTAAVGPVKARFKGRMELTDIVPPTSYRLNFDGQGGAAGFGKGTAQVQLAPEGPTVTRLSYTAHAQVGGKLAQIGSRLVDGAARKLADEFFQRFAAEFGAPPRDDARMGQAIPDIAIYIDSPMAVNATDVFRLHPEVFDRSEWLIDETDRLFDFPMVHYVRDVEESKRLNSLSGPAVIISASGMCESGRILHHLKNHIGNHRNLVLFVGYQASHTLGRRLKDGQKIVKIFGREVERHAEVATLEGYSAHADRDELRHWIQQLGGPVQRAFVVHAEPAAAEAMATILHEEGVAEVVVPKHGESFEL